MADTLDDALLNDDTQLTFKVQQALKADNLGVAITLVKDNSGPVTWGARAEIGSYLMGLRDELEDDQPWMNTHYENIYAFVMRPLLQQRYGGGGHGDDYHGPAEYDPHDVPGHH